MPVGRGANFKQVPLNIVGSSIFGIYGKTSTERTYNMTVSDNFLVPYPGYKIGVNSSNFNNGSSGRGLYESVKLNTIIGVFDNNVYTISVDYDHAKQKVRNFNTAQIGTLQTSSGVVYIAENNKPQILLSDGQTLYVYDPSITKVNDVFTADHTANTLTLNAVYTFAIGEPITLKNTGGALPNGLLANTTYYILSTTVSAGSTTITLAASQNDIFNNIVKTFSDNGSGTNTLNSSGPFQTVPTTFTPGYITFHDTYFIAAASGDTFYAPPADNTWHLSSQNNGFVWPSVAQTIGLLETKPDNTQAVVRFPSKGNMILVMGETVTEFWFDTGAQLFPYQRQNQGSIDYGCINPATVAFMDEVVIWLARNEKSGPVIMYTTGSMPEKITTDGIDFQFSELETPEDSQGFLYRKNGHLFYHLNFYTDNISYVVDLTAKKIYNACDENLNYYIMGQVVWFENQYFSITKNNANLFIFDTIFTTYDSVQSDGIVNSVEIPRIRVCKNIRLPSQDYFIANDIGFTIETGETNYLVQDGGPLYLITQDGKYIVTNDTEIVIGTQDGKAISAQDGTLLVTEGNIPVLQTYLIDENNAVLDTTPRVDFSVSYDGGASYGADFPYVLYPIGKRKNRLMWWQGGLVNDMVCQFKFWGIGAFVATDGVVNIRQ